jgi:S-adenosylmethionine:tRNA ribosyltransferase-isomerase
MLIKPKLAIEDFDYSLTDDQIAFTPTINRSDSKLLVWDQDIIAESHYKNIASHLPTNSTLLFNNSKVIAARILFEKNEQSNIEIFCLEPTEEYTPVLLAMQATNKVEWNCLVGGAKKWKEILLHKKVNINDQSITFSAKKIHQENGKFIIEFSWDHPQITFSEILTHIGNIPLPPYIQRKTSEEDKDRYQTTYAVEEGSVAAPTAGLHFSKDVFESLNEKSIHQKYLTLHVGAGTFMPVKSATIDEHNMHAEFLEVAKHLIQYLFEQAQKNTPPIIAVGTTSLRTIESLYWMGVKAHLYAQSNHKNMDQQNLHLGQWEAYELAEHKISVQVSMNALINWLDENKTDKLIAKTQLMVSPGYQFKICEGLITNFHQPKSTLLLIIAAITGDKWKLVYDHALKNAYRFLSYGDGCLFWIKQ